MVRTSLLNSTHSIKERSFRIQEEKKSAGQSGKLVDVGEKIIPFDNLVLYQFDIFIFRYYVCKYSLRIRVTNHTVVRKHCNVNVVMEKKCHEVLNFCKNLCASVH